MSASNLALEALRSVFDRPDTPESYDAMMATVHAAIAALEAETGEPVAWGMTRQDGLILDVICPKEHARYAGAYTIPLYTAQPPAVPQPKAGELSAQEIYDIAHRKCTRYTFTAQSTEVMYGFSEMHLLDFIAAINAKGAPA